MFSTPAHHPGGALAQPDVVAADGPATKTPGGEAATMRRRVVQEHVRAKVLDEAGVARISTDALPATAEGPRAADTLPVIAYRPS